MVPHGPPPQPSLQHDLGSWVLWPSWTPRAARGGGLATSCPPAQGHHPCGTVRVLGRVKAPGQGWPQLALGGVVLSEGLSFFFGGGWGSALGLPPAPGQDWVLGLALGPQLFSARAESAVKEQLNKDPWSFPGAWIALAPLLPHLGTQGRGHSGTGGSRMALAREGGGGAQSSQHSPLPCSSFPMAPQAAKGQPGSSSSWMVPGQGLARGPCRPPHRGSSSPPSPPPGCPRVGQGSRSLSRVSPWGLQHTGALAGLRWAPGAVGREAFGVPVSSLTPETPLPLQGVHRPSPQGWWAAPGAPP